MCVCCCVGARTQGLHDSLLQKVIHVCMCLHVCGRAVFHYYLVQGVCMSVFVYVFVCMCLCLYLCRCLRMHAVFLDSVLHSGVSTRMRACVRACCACVCVCVRLCACVCVCAYLCVRKFVCLCVRVYYCVYSCARARFHNFLLLEGLYVCFCSFLCAYLCVCLFMCVWEGGGGGG